MVLALQPDDAGWRGGACFSLPVVLVLCVAVLTGATAASEAPPARRHTLVFPGDDLFLAPVADPKQPRFFAALRSMRLRGAALPESYRRSAIRGGLVGFGGELGLWSLRRGGDGVQVGLSGGVFSQFNLSIGTADLINSDYVIGLPVSFRRGPWSLRLRGYHQSSHLGDEFLLHNPRIERLDISFEAADLLLSYEASFWRLYAGGGRLVGSNTPLRPGLAQAGLEVRGPAWGSTEASANRLRPLAAVGLDWFQARGPAGSASAVAGVESTSAVAHRQLRALLVYTHGYLAYGQFFSSERVEDFGFEMQFDF